MTKTNGIFLSSVAPKTDSEKVCLISYRVNNSISVKPKFEIKLLTSKKKTSFFVI